MSGIGIGIGMGNPKAIGVVAAAGLALLAVAPAGAQPPPPKAAGIETEGYRWNLMEGEKVEALDLAGEYPLQFDDGLLAVPLEGSFVVTSDASADGFKERHGRVS